MKYFISVLTIVATYSIFAPDKIKLTTEKNGKRYSYNLEPESSIQGYVPDLGEDLYDMDTMIEEAGV